MSDQMSFPVKECPFCGNGEDYVDGAYQHKLVHCHFCGETIKLETWQSRPIEDGLRAELARRDEQISTLVETVARLKEDAERLVEFGQHIPTGRGTCRASNTTYGILCICGLHDAIALHRALMKEIETIEGEK